MQSEIALLIALSRRAITWLPFHHIHRFHTHSFLGLWFRK